MQGEKSSPLLAACPFTHSEPSCPSFCSKECGSNELENGSICSREAAPSTRGSWAGVSAPTMATLLPSVLTPNLFLGLMAFYPAPCFLLGVFPESNPILSQPSWNKGLSLPVPNFPCWERGPRNALAPSPDSPGAGCGWALLPPHSCSDDPGLHRLTVLAPPGPLTVHY